MKYKISFLVSGWVEQFVEFDNNLYPLCSLQTLLNSGEILTSIVSESNNLVSGDSLENVGTIYNTDVDLEFTDFTVEDYE